MTEELAVIDVSQDLVLHGAPASVLAEARKAADALADVIAKKARPVIINGQQYLEFEDWQTCARFYGISAKVITTDYVEYGAAIGFSAKAVAIRSDGMEISAAESMCLNDEEKWKDRELFQLKSMAQTRACAKALRNVLSWVVVLAGYGATPAEELQGTKADLGRQPEQAVRADGVTTVKHVATKDGQSGRGPWTRFDVTFADGRRGSTFDKKVGEQAQALEKSTAPVVPDLKKTDKGTDLAGLAAPPKAQEPEPETPDVPETILTIRKVPTGADGKDWWALQGSERQYVCDDPALVSGAEKVKAAKAPVLFVYKAVPGRSGGIVRQVTALADPPPPATDASALPAEGGPA